MCYCLWKTCQQQWGTCMNIINSTCLHYPCCLPISLKEAAKMIKETMDKKFGAPWHAVVGEGFGFEITHEVKNLLYMFFQGNMAICVWKCAWCCNVCVCYTTKLQYYLVTWLNHTCSMRIQLYKKPGSRETITGCVTFVISFNTNLKLSYLVVKLRSCI